MFKSYDYARASFLLYACTPGSVSIRCYRCHWEQVFSPHSDALTQAPPQACPCCGNPELETSQISVIAAAFATLKHMISG